MGTHLINSYTAGWYVWGQWFLAVNHHSHKNWVQSILIHNFVTNFHGKQKNVFFSKKKIQNGRLKKRSFFKIANSQYFFVKIYWIGPWVSRIEWCKGHWCGSTYMALRLSDISSKIVKKCFFGGFLVIFKLMSDSLTTKQVEPHQYPSHHSILLTQRPIQ